MITKTDIIALAHNVIRRGKGIPDRRIMHPYREWYAGVIAALVLVCIGAAYNYYLFRYYNAIEERVTESDVRIVEYRYDTDDRVRERFDARAAAFADLYGERDMSVRTSADTAEGTDGASEGIQMER